MSKKHQKLNSVTCVVQRLKSYLVSIITHLFNIIWAMGASVAAAMAISTSTH